MNHDPSFETARLILRPHRKSDFAACHGLWTNPVIYEPILKRPSTEGETWSRMLKYAGLWSLLGFGYFAVIEKSSNRMIGELGLADFHRELTPSISGVPEMGWVLDPEFHGKGIMSEAIAGLMEWGKAHLKSDKLVCIIDPTNSPSIRLAERSGFKMLGDAIYEGKRTLLFECRLR